MNFLLLLSLTGFLSLTLTSSTSTSEPYSTPTTDDYHPTFPMPPRTGTGCPTITYSTGSACSLPTPCIRPLCLLLSTVTVPCGCVNGVAVTTQCETTCDGKCGTAYSTVYVPCPTSLSHTSDECSDTRCHTKHTSIETLTRCPHDMSCHGQTTTWTGTVGPSSCHGTCTCILPTFTGTDTGSTPTPTPTGSSSGTGTGNTSNTSPTPTGTGSTSGTAGSQTGTGTVTSSKPTTTATSSTPSQVNAGGKVSGGHGSLVWFFVGVFGLL